MRPIIAKIKPADGFSKLLRLSLGILLPLLVFVLVRMDFVPFALGFILLSKWRMFVVRPRFWLANIRANSVDIIVNLAFFLFIIKCDSTLLQLMWVGWYGLWLTVIKPASSVLVVSLQGMIGLTLGLTALFIGLGDGPLYWLVMGSGLICFLSARHFLDSFDEPYAKLLAYTWGFFGAALTWILGHWLLFYANNLLAQPTVLLVSVGYGLSALYYLDHHDRLSKLVRLEIMVVTGVIILAIFVSLLINVTATVHELLR